MPYFGVKINISPVLFSGKHGSNVLGHFVQTFSLIFLQQLKKLIQLVTIQMQITQTSAIFLFSSLLQTIPATQLFPLTMTEFEEVYF